MWLSRATSRLRCAGLRLASRASVRRIVDHAVDGPGLKPASPETAAWLSLVAYVRHVFTDYNNC